MQPGKVSEVMQAFHTFLGTNDMMAYLAMMAPRLIELRRVLKPTGSLSARFDKETYRTLSRTTGMTDEFAADRTKFAVSCYPVEAVTKSELKSNETDGWSEQTGVQYRRFMGIARARKYAPARQV